MDLWEGTSQKDKKTNQTITSYTLKKNMNNTKVLTDVFDALGIPALSYR